MEVPAARLPALLRHMTLAIAENLPGGEKDKFLSAFAISRSRLVEWKYLTPPSKQGPLDRISLTSAGIKKNKKHLNEGRVKNLLFERLYEKYRADIEMETVEKEEKEE